MRTASLASRVRWNAKRVMRENKMLAADVARQAGRTRPWMSYLLSGVRLRRLSTLDELADALGVDASELFRPIARSGVESAHTQYTGGASHADTRLLRQQLARTEAQLEELREAVAATTQSMGALLGSPTRQRAPRKAKAGKNGRGHDR
jgi:transcriptional regulator with XRE-family HTH domain